MNVRWPRQKTTQLASIIGVTAPPPILDRWVRQEATYATIECADKVRPNPEIVLND
jgi:hypothetical protein